MKTELVPWFDRQALTLACAIAILLALFLVVITYPKIATGDACWMSITGVNCDEDGSGIVDCDFKLTSNTCLMFRELVDGHVTSENRLAVNKPRFGLGWPSKHVIGLTVNPRPPGEERLTIRQPLENYCKLSVYAGDRLTIRPDRPLVLYRSQSMDGRVHEGQLEVAELMGSRE